MPVKRFLNGEDGAVTVDFVVLTAAIAGLGSAVLLSAAGGTTELADTVGNYLTDLEGGSEPPTYGKVLSTKKIGDSLSSVTITQYQMSNGEVWTETVASAGGGAAVSTTWTDADGNPVDPPEPTA